MKENKEETRLPHGSKCIIQDESIPFIGEPQLRSAEEIMLEHGLIKKRDGYMAFELCGDITFDALICAIDEYASQFKSVQKEMEKKLSHFLNWVDKETYFFQDKDVTVSQVVQAYLGNHHYMKENKEQPQLRSLQECKDQVAKECSVFNGLSYSYKGWQEMQSYLIQNDVIDVLSKRCDEAAELYASQFKSVQKEALPLNFWLRLEMFVSNVQVSDPMSEEEKEMILSVANRLKAL